LRSHRHRLLWSSRLVAAALFVVLTLGLSQADAEPGTVRVIRVIDGDTIVIEGGEHVRYLGVDTPETVHPTKPVQCYGPEASAANRRLVEGRRVRLEQDVSDRDAYGRLLRSVYVDGLDASAELVRQGYGYVIGIPPDISHLAEYASLEDTAREEHRGLWGACK
jgi:micrococcal nuclease